MKNDKVNFGFGFMDLFTASLLDKKKLLEGL